MKRLRAICLGATGTGKTTLLATMNDKRFVRVAPTVGVDFSNVVCEGVRFLCWDTSGDPKFDRIASIFTRDCCVFIYVFDLTRPETLNNALDWYCEVKKIDIGPRVHVFIGNKSDLSYQGQYAQNTLRKYADITYYKTSAKFPTDVERVWKSIRNDTAHLRETSLAEMPSSPHERVECCHLQ